MTLARPEVAASFDSTVSACFDVSTPEVIPVASPASSVEPTAVSPAATPTDVTGEHPVVDCARAVVLVHLAELRRHGDIPGDVMAEMAERLGVCVGHLRRLLRHFEKTKKVHRPAGSTKKLLLPDVWKAQVLYFVYAGNAYKTFEDLGKKGLLPSKMDLRTFQRRVNEWDPALIACAKGGYRAMVKHQFFNVEHMPYRCYAYGTDHTFLPIQVLPSRGSTKPVWPWLTTVMDLKTRVLLSFKLTIETPNTIDCIDSLVEAVDGWYTPDGMFVGGKPEFLRSDRGSDYLSKALALNLFDLEIEPRFSQAYSSWQNGVVERLNGTVDRDFSPEVPGYHPGGEEEYTRRVLKTPVAINTLTTVDDLNDRLEEFFGNYNNRPHSALKGLTPLEAWAAETRPITRADKGTIVHAMTNRGTRRLHHYGIEIRGTIYSHPTLARLRKEHVKNVEVRYHERDRDRIEVFVDGVHECTAVETSVQPQHQRFAVLAIREAQQRKAARLIRLAQYERVVNERERQRERGADESEWPTLPTLPDDDEDLDGPGYTGRLSKSQTGLLNARLDEREHTDDDQEGIAS